MRRHRRQSLLPGPPGQLESASSSEEAVVAATRKSTADPRGRSLVMAPYQPSSSPVSGHVILNIRISVHDAAALIEAGQRSYARDLSHWRLGIATPPLPRDAATIIAEPARAAADLLIEAFVHCYMPYSGPVIESLAGIIEFGDVDSKDWYPGRGA